MANRQVPPMDADFPRWYRAVALGDNGARQQARWAGLASLVADATRDDVETLIRLAYRAKQTPSASAVARIRKPFKDVDENFETRENDREVEVLSGAALTVLCRDADGLGPTAALAVTTTGCAGGRTANVTMDLVAAAEEGLASAAEAVRGRPNIEQYLSKPIPSLDLKEATAKVREQANADGFAEAFGLAAKAIGAAVATVAKNAANAVSSANRFIAVQDEELQMLWWLVGERSWDFDCRFEAVAAESRPLILAKELAEMTNFLPGPRCITALLARAGLSERKKLTIPTAVNACSTDWLRKLVEGREPSAVTQPIHFAIKRKLETGDDTSWVAAWAAATELDATRMLSALTIGRLFYRERLLSHFEE